MAPVTKSKQVTKGKFASALATMKRPAAAAELEEEQQLDVAAPTVLKRPASAMEDGAGKPAVKKAAKKRSDEALRQEEEAITAQRTKELTSMKVAELKELLSGHGLDIGLKDEMVKTMLAHEAKIREETRAHERKVREVLDKKRADLTAKAVPELKELCSKNSLKQGGAKGELVDRLLGHSKESGEVDRILAAMAREARQQELSNMSKESLHELCGKAGVDVLVKEVMVERLLSHEAATVAA